jgi:RHS repeat-associated protein
MGAMAVLRTVYVATSTPITRYNHPDNLGSTNVTSDTSGNLAQLFDYAPYGSVLENYNTGTTTAERQYIGQFSDASGLSYLNARYYNPSQGQFLSEDPVFLGAPLQQDLGASPDRHRDRPIVAG